MTHLGDLLSALLDGELDSGARRRTEAHLAGCESCRLELARVESARGALRRLPMLETPPGLIPGVRRGRRFLSPARVSAIAAMAALVAALVIGPGAPGTAFQLDDLGDQHDARVVGDPGIATFRGDRP